MLGSRGDVIVPPCGEHVASCKKQAKVPPCGPPADAGEAVVITRRGELFVELAPCCSALDLLPRLAALRDALAEQPVSSVETLRVLRKESRACCFAGAYS